MRCTVCRLLPVASAMSRALIVPDVGIVSMMACRLDGAAAGDAGALLALVMAGVSGGSYMSVATCLMSPDSTSVANIARMSSESYPSRSRMS